MAPSTHRHRRRRLRGLPRRSPPVPSRSRQRRHHTDQPDRLLPVPAGAARGHRGILDPRQITIPVADTLPGVQPILGEVTSVDPERRRVHYHDQEGRCASLGYDRLLLTAGSVNKLLPIPGVADNAHGLRGLPEALYLRDHLIRQVELAATSDDPAERAARLTFVVVGAGYAGTEITAQGQLLTTELAARHPHLGEKPRWLLLDHGDKILAHLDHRLSDTATRVLTQRGVDVRTSPARGHIIQCRRHHGTFLAGLRPAGQAGNTERSALAHFRW